MKKTISTIALMLAAAAVWAVNPGSELTLSFSTQGPDAYADGTPVAVGETYLLVYVAQGAAFAGVQMDGTLVDPVNNKIATTSTAIRGAKCAFKAIQYPDGLFPSSGSWTIVLLDTRDEAGVPGGLVAASGSVAAGQAAASGSTSLAALNGPAAGGITASAAASVPAGTVVPVPEITEVAVGGGKASLRIADFADNVIYQVETATDLSSWEPAAGAARVQGKSARAVLGKGGRAELPAEVPVSEGDKVRFFRVIVPGTN